MIAETRICLSIVKHMIFLISRFESKSIQVEKSSINIEGVIEFAGVKKVIKTKARLINLQDSEFSIEGEFEILLSEFGIERPSLMFVKIEDSVKIKYSIKGVHNE